MEFGPRALGSRSILASPIKKENKDLLNLKIKKREKFRPFAPIVHYNKQKITLKIMAIAVYVFCI